MSPSKVLLLPKGSSPLPSTVFANWTAMAHLTRLASLWAALQVFVAAADAATSKSAKCHAPKVDTKCHSEAMLDGFAKHPEHYIGLTTKSNYRDFQAYFWNLGMHDCPRPCMAQEEACVKFDEKYPCMQDVMWAAYHGIVENPEWYPELRTGLPLKDFALVLYTHGQPGCPRPCDEGEPEGHFVPYNPKVNPEDEDEDKESPKSKSDKRKIADDDEEDATSAAEPKQIQRLKSLLRFEHASKTVQKLQMYKDDCARPGVLWTPAMSDTFVRSLKSSNECRFHCRKYDGAGYYLYYASLGICHCAVYGATKQEVADVNNLAGRVDCGEDWEKVNKETAKLVEAVDSGCFKMNVGYGPAVGEPIPTKVKDAVECQEKLRSSGMAAAQHFVFYPLDSTCRIVAPGAPEMHVPDIISGPKTCEAQQIQIAMKADFRQMAHTATTRRLVWFIGVPSGVMMVLLIVGGAIFSVQKRIRRSTARDYFFKSRGEDMDLSMGLDLDDCIEE
ncbi:unnamed protein product [Effrenium voratum]|nr:unnamed protein product [Effrenium voratum]